MLIRKNGLIVHYPFSEKITIFKYPALFRPTHKLTPITYIYRQKICHFRYLRLKVNRYFIFYQNVIIAKTPSKTISCFISHSQELHPHATYWCIVIIILLQLIIEILNAVTYTHPKHKATTWNEKITQLLKLLTNITLRCHNFFRICSTHFVHYYTVAVLLFMLYQ